MTICVDELLEEVRTKNVSPLCDGALDQHWDAVWKLFKDLPSWALLYDERWTYFAIKKGQIQVWAYSDTEIRGIMATRINVFPKCKVLEVVGLSGISGIEFMQNLDDVCEHLARQNDCAYLLTGARPGMERVLRKNHRAERMFSVLVRPVGLLRRT